MLLSYNTSQAAADTSQGEFVAYAKESLEEVCKNARLLRRVLSKVERATVVVWGLVSREHARFAHVTCHFCLPAVQTLQGMLCSS